MILMVRVNNEKMKILAGVIRYTSKVHFFRISIDGFVISEIFNYHTLNHYPELYNLGPVRFLIPYI